MMNDNHSDVRNLNNCGEETGKYSGFQTEIRNGILVSGSIKLLVRRFDQILSLEYGRRSESLLRRLGTSIWSGTCERGVTRRDTLLSARFHPCERLTRHF